MEGFDGILHSWQNFYFMSGGAAATLIGLMFVALSLGVGLVSETTSDDMRIFVTPSVFYFVSVLLLACIMLVPVFTPLTLAIALFLAGAIGLVISARVARGLIRVAKKHQDFDRRDWIFQVTGPSLAYIMTLLSAVCLALNQWLLAFGVAWLSTILLLVCAIANTWSLVIWIVEQRK